MISTAVLLGVSKSHINRCGTLLSDAWLRSIGPESYDSEDLAAAYSIVSAYRTAHQRPMSSVAMGLRSMVKTATGSTPFVSQRLKRVPRIIRKIARMNNSTPTMLARLEDIGGCRAVVANPQEVDLVARRIEKQWGHSITRRRDYVTGPSPMGYRALHFTVPRNDLKIEVQLRTRGQQSWANAIESADSAHKLTLKDGIGPTSMIDYFAAAGDVIYHQEYGVTAPTELLDRLREATDLVIAEGFYSRRRA